jgi:hypothetical protein
MKRPLLFLIALVIAVAPAAEVCRLDCERPKQPECPLHQQTPPHTCAHDHTIGTATLNGANAGAPRPAGPAIAVTPGPTTIEPIALDQSRLDRRHSPPPRSPRIDVLRI